MALLAATVAPAANAAGATAFTLVKGSELELMVLREVDSNEAQPGDEVRLMLNRPVTLADGTVLAEMGTRAAGVVTESKKAGLALQRGTMRVAFKSLTVDGVALPLTGEIKRRGKGGKADDALKIVLVPFYALFSPGNSAKLKAGDTVYVLTETELCLSAVSPVQLAECPVAAVTVAAEPAAPTPAQP